MQLMLHTAHATKCTFCDVTCTARLYAHALSPPPPSLCRNAFCAQGKFAHQLLALMPMSANALTCSAPRPVAVWCCLCCCSGCAGKRSSTYQCRCGCCCTCTVSPAWHHAHAAAQRGANCRPAKRKLSNDGIVAPKLLHSLSNQRGSGLRRGNGR